MTISENETAEPAADGADEDPKSTQRLDIIIRKPDGSEYPPLGTSYDALDADCAWLQRAERQALSSGDFYAAEAFFFGLLLTRFVMSEAAEGDVVYIDV